jgi:hypothetical protein
MRLQTQRERLEAMNLSPAQARQLLETLRAQEQQYLQQLRGPAHKNPTPANRLGEAALTISLLLIQPTLPNDC